MKTSRLTILAFGTSFLASAVLLQAGAAQAAVKRLVAAAFCQPDFAIVPFIGDSYRDTVDRSGGTIEANTETTLTCGYPSDDTLPHGDVTTIFVRGFRGSQGIFLDSAAKACVGTFSATQHCGNQTDFNDPSSGTFSKEIADLSEWTGSNRSAFYPYVSVNLQSDDRIYGITVSNN